MKMRKRLSSSFGAWALAAGLGGWLAGRVAQGAITLPSPAEATPPRPPAILVPPPLDPFAKPHATTSSAAALAPDVARPLRLTVELGDGSRIIGVPSITNLPMRAGFGTVKVDLSTLQSAQFQPDKETATVLFQNGDKVSGAFSLESLELQTTFGQVKIPLTVIRRIAVSPGGKSRQGLVLHYTFDQEDDTAVKDQSGQGHDGKLLGAKWTPQGKFGGGCTINGGVEEIAVGAAEKITLEDYTLALWLKRADPNRTSSGAHHAVIFGLRGTKELLFGAEADGRLYAQGPDGRRTVPARIADLQWHHLAVVKRAKTAAFYLDGEACGEVEFGQTSDLSKGLGVGSVGGQVGYPFIGSLDEVMIFERCLSAEEVKQMATSIQ
jgi:hypothetical protein